MGANLLKMKFAIAAVFLLLIVTGCEMASPSESLASETAIHTATATLFSPASPTTLLDQPTTTTLVPTARPSATPLPSPTFTPLPTVTQPPFLPADLGVINPQNAAGLQPVAALPDPGASVVGISPDDRILAAGFFRTNEVKIYDLASGKEQLTLKGHVDPRSISYLAFSPDGTQLASCAWGWDDLQDSLIIWEARTGGELQRFDGVIGAISPDWRLVALSQRERGEETTMRLVDLATGVDIHILPAPSEIYSVVFSPKGDQVAGKMFSVFQDLFAFWSVDSGLMDRTLYDWVGFSYSPDGRFVGALIDIGAGDHKAELNLFEASTFKWLRSLAKDVDSLWFAYPAFSPDGKVVAASRGDKLTLWDTQTWQVLISLPTGGPTGSLFSPDGRFLATFTQSSEVQLWGVIGK